MRLRSFFVFCAISCILSSASVWPQIKGYDDSFADAVPAVIQNLTAPGLLPPEVAGCFTSPKNRFLSATQFTAGFAYIGSTLYGLEWENGSGPRIFLYTLEVVNGCFEGTRVGTQPIRAAAGPSAQTLDDSKIPEGGTIFTNLEALVYSPADGFLYSADFTFSNPHIGHLIRIDPATAVAEATASSQWT